MHHPLFSADSGKVGGVVSIYRINGGAPVSGTVRVSGNKNAALPCIAATLLTNDPVILHNIPAIEDVSVMLSLLQCLGSSVLYLDDHTIQITSGDRTGRLPSELVDAVRGSILLAGPLAASAEGVRLPPPGGDVIGLRRLDTHFIGLTALGASCTVEAGGTLHIYAPGRLIGADVFLDEASVTATENVIMAAVSAKGRTIIRNAASEPHVQDLCNLLNRMGASISGIGSNLLTIEGVDELHGCDFTIGCDFMEVGSFIGLAAATKGDIVIEGVDAYQFPMIRLGFSRIGIRWEDVSSDTIHVPSEQERVLAKDLGGKTAKIDDSPWPGFPADLLSIMTVAATQMNGSILIHEKMFESRMFFIDWLIRMGADIVLCDPHRAVVNGPCKLHGAIVTSPDVRAGMALVIAALCADGRTEIQNIYQIERGYEGLADKLLALGADIERLS